MAALSQIKILTVVKKKYDSNCIIKLSNEDVFECSGDLVIKYALTKDKIITNEIVLEIKSQNRLYEAKQAAYNFASYKPRSISQVKNKLKEKGYTPFEINNSIEFLKEFNLLDDEKYAGMLIDEFVKRKFAGEKKNLRQTTQKRD